MANQIGIMTGGGVYAVLTLPDAAATLASLALAETLSNKTLDASNVATQAALTAITAGASITVGISGFAPAGSRFVVPTGGLVYAQIFLTATGAIAAGAVVGTISGAPNHRPFSTVPCAGAQKFTGGALTSPVAATVLVNGAGAIVTETALASGDTLAAMGIWMTS